METVNAPWTEEQMKILDDWQFNVQNHPYTCLEGHTLYVSRDGFVCPICEYTQDWCYAYHFSKSATKK
jgi:hypothetical protein